MNLRGRSTAMLKRSTIVAFPSFWLDYQLGSALFSASGLLNMGVP